MKFIEMWTRFIGNAIRALPNQPKPPLTERQRFERSKYFPNACQRAGKR